VITEIKSEEKFKHLNKLGAMLLQCISCGDCREATDYTSDPQKWGVCVARDHTSGFEAFFGRGKMQIIRSLWQGKLELSRDLAEVFFQCPTCNACAETCAYDMDNAVIYEALRAELVDAGYGLEVHIPMNKAVIELLNPYERDNKQKNSWLEKIDFKIKDATKEKTDLLYFVGCTAALTPEIQNVAINTAKVLKKLNIDFSVLGEFEVCCGSVAKRTGDLNAFNFVLEKNHDLFKKSGVRTIITSCAGCYRTLKADYKDIMQDLNIEVLHTIEFLRRIIKERSIKLNPLDISVTYHDPCHTGRNVGIKEGLKPLYEEPRAILRNIANLNEMKTIKENAKCCGAGGGLKKGFPELALNIAKSRIKEAEETRADYLVSICPFCYRNLNDAIKSLNSNIKMVDLMKLLNQALS
jgi:heterodisulfide reductase subunit D